MEQPQRIFMHLADMMRETLSDIPGVIAEPSQPIQMRFNELMTGIRQDVAIKIFGENMDSLAALCTKSCKSYTTNRRDHTTAGRESERVTTNYCSI